VKRCFSAVLCVLVLTSILSAPPLASRAQAESWWQIDLSTLVVCILGEGDPDTPDFRGTSVAVYDEDGKLVEVDQAWLRSVLLGTAFESWSDLF
jgi:hypothetical protein